MEAYTCGSPTAQILGEWSSSRSSLQPIRRPRISESLRRPQRAPTESSDFSIPETYSSSDDDLQHAGRSSPPPPHDGVRHNNNNDVQRSNAMVASPPPPPDHDGNSRRSTGKFLSPPPQQTHAEMHPNSNAHPPPVVAASSPPPHAEMYHPKNSRSSTALFSSPPPEQHNADYSTNTSQPAPALIPPTDQRHAPPSRSAPPPTWWLNHPTPEEAAATSSRGAPRRRRGKHPHPVRMMKEPQLIPYEVAWPRTTRDLTKAPQQHQHAPAAPSRPTAAATARDSSSQRPLPTSVAPTTTTNNLAQNDVSERSITPPSGHHRKPVDEHAPPTQHVPPTHGVPPHATSSRRPTDAQDDVSERSITPPSGYRRERLPSHYLQGDASSTVVQDAPHAVHRLEPLTPQRPAATTLEVMMQDEGHVAAPHHTSPLPPITPRTLSPAPPITTPLLMDDRPPTAPSRRPQHTTPLLSASNSSAALAPSRTVAAPVDGVESAHANPNTNEWADVAKEGGGAHGSQPRLMRNNDEIEPRTEVEEVLLGTMTGSTPLRRRFSSETPRFIRRAPTSSVSAPFDDSIDDGDDSDIPSSVRSPRRSAPHPATQRAMNAAPEEEAVPQAPQQPADASHHSAEEAGTKLVPSTRRRSEGAKYDGDADAARNANDDSSEVRVKDEIVPRTEVGDVLLGTMTGSTPLRLRFSSETSQKWAPLHHSRSSPVDYSINSGLPAEAVHASAQPAPHPATQRAMDAAPEEEDVPLSVHHPEDAPQQSGEEAQSTPVPSTHRESEEAKDGDAHVARNTHDDPSGRRAQDEIEPRTEVEDVLLGTTTGSTPLRRRFSSETPRFIRRAPTSSVSAPFDDSIDEGDDVPSSVRSPSRSALHPATQRAMNSAPEEEAKQDVPRAPQQPADASLLAHPEDAPQQSGEEAQSTPVPSTYRESEEAKDVDAHVERNTNDDPSGGSAQDEIEPRTEVEDVLLGTMTGSTPLQRRFSSETPRFIRRAPTSSIDDSDVPSSVRSMPRSAPHPATQRAMNAAPEEEEEEAAPQAPQQPEDASHHSAEEAGTPSAANRTLHNSPSPTSHPNAQVSSNAEVENLRRSPPLQTLGSYSESAIAPRTVPLSPDNRGAVMSEGESVPSASHSHVVQTRRPRKAPAPSSSSVVSGDGAETTEEAAPQGAGDAAPHQHVDHPPSPTADRHSIRPADDEETPPLPQQHTSANMLGVEDESFIPSPIHQLSEIDVDR